MRSLAKQERKQTVRTNISLLIVIFLSVPLGWLKACQANEGRWNVICDVAFHSSYSLPKRLRIQISWGHFTLAFFPCDFSFWQMWTSEMITKSIIFPRLNISNRFTRSYPTKGDSRKELAVILHCIYPRLSHTFLNFNCCLFKIIPKLSQETPSVT